MRERSSTIDTKQNGKNAYIYSELALTAWGDPVMLSNLCIDEFLYQDVHVDIGQTAHAVFC